MSQDTWKNRNWPDEFIYNVEAPVGHLPLTNCIRGAQAFRVGKQRGPVRAGDFESSRITWIAVNCRTCWVSQLVDLLSEIRNSWGKVQTIDDGILLMQTHQKLN